MRVNDVIMIRIDGAIDSTVSSDQLDRALGDAAIALAEIDADVLRKRRLRQRGGG
jgi:hypothetical protein